MPLDGVTARFLAAELNQCLGNARVDRIFQPDRYDVVLQLRGGAISSRLVLSANPASPRIHLTREARENPESAPMFCMLLRKHLLGARLLDISTPGYERLFRLVFDSINEVGDHQEKVLVVEIMGRHSNIVLLNQDQKILDAILHVDEKVNRVREIMPARAYVPPPDQAKTTPEDMLAKLNKPIDNAEPWSFLAPESAALTLEKAILASIQGFSPQLCMDVLLRADLDPRLRPGNLDPARIERLRLSLAGVLGRIVSGQIDPSLFWNDNDRSPADFHALPLLGYLHRQPAGSLSDAMDHYFRERLRDNTFQQQKQHLARLVNNQLDHMHKKLDIHEADRKASASYDDLRRMGDLILANLHAAKPDQAILRAIDYSLPDQPKIDIPLRSSLSASQNAQRYYRLYQKAKAKYTYACRLAAEDLREITYLESIRNAIETAAEPDDLAALKLEISALEKDQQPAPGGKRKARRKPGKAQAASRKRPARPAVSRPRRYTSSDGLTILVGRNNLQNDQLTLKTAQKTDLWLHVQHIPGTHVIVQAAQREVPEQTLLEAAGIAAWFSRAALALPVETDRKHPKSAGSSRLKIAVDYCPVSHVRKPAGAKPGMVIYEHYKTVLVDPRDPKDLQADEPQAEGRD